MAVNLSTFNFKKLPWAFIVAVLVAFVIQIAFASVSVLQNYLFVFSAPSLSDPLRVEYFLKQSKDDPGKKILFVGTSQSREGFDVNVLNDRFKEEKISFYNRGTAAYSAIDLYMEIGRILDAEPDLIVYMPYLGNFYLDYDFKRLKYYYSPKILSFISRNLGVHVLYENKWLILDAYLSNGLYFYKYREELKPVLFSFLDYVLFGLGEEVEPEYYRYDKNFGPEYFEDHIKKSKGNKFYYSTYTEVEKRAFIETLKTIKKNSTPFLVVEAPVHPLIEKVHSSEVGTDYEAFINETMREYGIAFISKDNMPTFSSDDFVDFTHLNATGRKKLTDYFAFVFQEKYMSMIN